MPHFPICTVCGLIMGDKILHDKWHRDLEAKIKAAGRFDPRDAPGWSDGH